MKIDKNTGDEKSPLPSNLEKQENIEPGCYGSKQVPTPVNTTERRVNVKEDCGGGRCQPTCLMDDHHSSQFRENNLKSFMQLITEFQQGHLKKCSHTETAKYLEKRKRESDKELRRQAVKYIQQQIRHKNVTVFKGETELRGKHRFVADGFADDSECDTLVQLGKIAGIPGDGYKGKKSPHTDLEEFLGLTVGRTALMVYFGLLEPEALEKYLDISERAQAYIETYFKLKKKLYFDYTHLVCRSAIVKGPDTSIEPHMSHPIHGDNCNIQENGSCIKAKPSYTWRDYSAIVYLNDDFEGGEFVFAANGTVSSIQTSVESKCGRMVAFTSGGENLHGVRGVTRGSRCAIGLWFTFEKQHNEVERILAQKVLDQVKNKGSVSDQLLNNLKMMTKFDINIELKRHL